MRDMQKENDTLKPGDMVKLAAASPPAALLWNIPFGAGLDDKRHATGELLKGEIAMFIAYSDTKLDVLVLASGPRLGWIWVADLERA